jgi:hypothetical protein
MKIVLSGILLACLLAVVASVVLGDAQRPAYEVFATESTRVGDPGHNLVGSNWSGLNTEGPDVSHQNDRR